MANVLGSSNATRPKARGKSRIGPRSALRLTIVYLMSAIVASVTIECILRTLKRTP
jgi:hypothetical protein